MELPEFLIVLIHGIGFGGFCFAVPLLVLATLLLAAIASDGRGILLNMLNVIGYWPLLAAVFYLMLQLPWPGETPWWPLVVIPAGLLSCIIPAILLRSAIRGKNKWEIAEHICSLLAVGGETVAIMLICYCGRFH